ncbi:MAG: hypothetical protein Q9196_005361 [Gyalolechia fulgens]
MLDGLICKADIEADLSAIDLLRRMKTITHNSSSQSAGAPLLPSLPFSGWSAPPANTLLLFHEHERQDWLEEQGRECRDWNDPGAIHPQVVLDINISRNGLLATLHYSPSTLSVKSAPNVSNVYLQAIQGILTSPTRNVQEIDLFSPRDLDQLRFWNQPFPEKFNACVHELVLEHAKVSPNAPALCSWDGNVTYHELATMSSRLARVLIVAGVGPETLVPVCFSKSFAAIVVMVAIHRSGGALVPLDPSHPKDRLRAVVHKAKAAVVVVSPETAPLFDDISVTVVQVTSSMLESSDLASEDLLPAVRPDHAAIVLFTSGSTGKPKGILQEHASVCTSSLAHGRALNISSHSRVFQYAAFTFDVSMMDIFTTLIYGGCVCIPSDQDRMGSFTAVMNRMRVNWVLFTPSVASLIAPEDVPTLQTLVYGGEAVKQENVSRWVGHVRVFNCYGPAECGACAIGEFFRPDSRPANIGRQFGGELCWVVDPENHHRLLPIGAIGELVVEGPTLARGYLDEPVKTQASFIKSPGWPQGVGCNRTRRIYKTGDLVRQNSNGTFDFVGRKDLQVKVRGQRVEIGEVEHHLATVSGIALSMVARPLSGPYAHTLVAIVQLIVPGGIPVEQGDELGYLRHDHVLSAHFDREKLLDCLKARLPSYMVPTHVLIVTKLPLSVSGKIDRKIVDAWLVHTSRPTELIGSGESLKGLPRDDSISREICSKVLSLVSNPGSSFFNSLDGTDFPLAAVGLDSIKTINLIMYARQRYGVKIGLDVLTNPKATIGSIGRAVANILRNGGTRTAERKIDVMDMFQAYRKKVLEGVPRSGAAPLNVMLTGATGFLGSRILRELCRDPNVHRIMAHVRSQSSQKALQRIVQSAVLAGWWSHDCTGKIEAWPGDLAKPRLGLSTDHWNRLCGHGSPQGRVTAIIHNGAKINWNANFSVLKTTNVDATIDLLEAASESTALSEFLFVSGGQQLRFEEDNDFDIAEAVGRSNGYAQTKLLSELMVKEYARSVAPRHQRISIIKPGYIIGGIDHGTSPTDDFIWRLTASCADTRSYNADDANSWLFISDVDRVAATITDCCGADAESLPRRRAQVVKIFDGLVVSEYWNIVKQELGHEVRPLQADVWATQLSSEIETRGEKHPLWPLLETIEQGQGKLGTTCNAPEVLGQDNSRVRAAIRKNIDYLRSVGFLSDSTERRIPKDKVDKCLVQTPIAVLA